MSESLKIAASKLSAWIAPDVAEPVSHANDALSFPEEDQASLGLKILQAGETLTLRMRLDVITRPRA